MIFGIKPSISRRGGVACDAKQGAKGIAQISDLLHIVPLGGNRISTDHSNLGQPPSNLSLDILGYSVHKVFRHKAQYADEGMTIACKTCFAKYRYKVLRGKTGERICAIARQACKEMGVMIVSWCYRQIMSIFS